MSVDLDLSPLFTAYQIKNIYLRNRFVMPAMQRGWCENGCPTTKMAEYYRKRAAGGVALIIGESGAIDHPSSTCEKSAAHIYGPAIEGWSRCIDSVKEEGGHMFLQLWFQGAVGNPPKGHPPLLSPSGLIKKGQPNGEAASLEDLENIKRGFVRSALLAKEIGASGVEVHGAHGYGLDLFLWDQTNLRSDHYGGESLEDRLRYPIDIVKAIRASVGPDFIISFRFSQWKEADFYARIFETPSQLHIFLTGLADAGVDMFHPSTRRFFEPEWPESTIGLAGWCKRFTDRPVVAVGSVGLDRDLVSNIFRDEEARYSGQQKLQELVDRFTNKEFDLVAIGRSLIGDPDWIEKIRTGRFQEIRSFIREDLMKDIEWDTSFVSKQ